MHKYQQVNFFSNVIKYVRPTYSNKEELATLSHHMENEHTPPGVNVLRYPCGSANCSSVYKWRGLELHIKEKHTAPRSR